MPLRPHQFRFYQVRLYRAALAAAMLVFSAAEMRAQMHHTDKPEKVTRAVGVYEWTGDLNKPTSSRLVPVSLFIDARFQAAGTYLARPVPLALETGNVYSIERAGQPLGTLDVKGARDIATAHDAADDNPVGAWYGFGPFVPPTKLKVVPLKASTNIASVSGTQDDDRPHFVAPRAESTDNTPATTRKSASLPDDDAERPTLGRRTEGTTTASADDKEKKPKRQKPQGYVTGVGDSLNDDPDRPSIRRGKAEEDSAPQLEGLPAGMHQAVAVSDPAVHDEHVFTRAWESASEHSNVQAKMRSLAEPIVRSYMQANGLVPGTPTPALLPADDSAQDTSAAPPRLQRTPGGISTRTTPTITTRSGARTSAGKKPVPAAPTIEGEALYGYNLSYGGLPVFVYTAQVAASPTQARTANVKVYVALVAQQLPSGDIQVALKSATDSGHLDRTPWMRFVDAVDADGSHRASLLFEQRATHSRQFALYRLISSDAEQTFITPLLE